MAAEAAEAQAGGTSMGLPVTEQDSIPRTRLTLREVFLAPVRFRDWDESTFDSMRECFAFVDEPERAEFRRSVDALSKDQFQQTLYFHIVRSKVLTKHRPRCSYCSARHHLGIIIPPEIRADAHNHVQSITILCALCCALQDGDTSPQKVRRVQERRLKAWKRHST